MFFYKSPSGGRVFFDRLGWPWPKHPCTDNKVSQTATIRQPKRSSSGGVVLTNAEGTTLDIYELDEMPREKDGWTIKLRRLRDRAFFRVVITDAVMKKAKLVWDDWHEAPSFIVAPSIQDEPNRRIEFICGRLKRVVSIELPKA